MVVVGAVQFAVCGSLSDYKLQDWLDKWVSNAQKNLKKAESLIREAHAAGAQIILVQELFEGIYFPQIQHEKFFSLAKSSNVSENHVLQHMSDLAAELSVVLPVSFFERHNNAYYNSVVVFDSDGTSLGIYRKSHIPDGPGYQEKFYFNPGDTGFQVFNTAYGKIGVAVCWDQWFPEAARSMVLQGAEVLFYPTAIGSEPTKEDLDSREHWLRVMQGHSAANLVPIVTSNRIGVEDQLNFYGNSFICDHTGKIVSSASQDKSEVITAEFDFNKIREDRAFWGVFRDRRPDLYQTLQTLDGETSSWRRRRQPRHRRHHQKRPKKTVSNSEIPRELVKLNLTTPLTDGFNLAAEWERHQQHWIAWPFRRDVWKDDAEHAQDVFESVAREIAKSERVVICCLPDEADKLRSERFRDGDENIEIMELGYNDAWMRDIGPSFVVNRVTGQVRGVDWNFNAWGGAQSGCYSDWNLDEHVASQVLGACGLERYKCPLILEGGSIHCDGVGTLITTEQCLLNRNRNPQCSKGDIERLLMLYLGVKKVIWLPLGVFSDIDTDGHVDNLCCFVSEYNIALNWTDDVSDPQYPISKATFDILSAETDALGRPLKLHKIHQPSPQAYTLQDVKSLHLDDGSFVRKAGDRLPASYINFCITNDAVLIPKFDDPNDALALEKISSLFPSRRCVLIENARNILLGGGNIHCITLQQPKYGLKRHSKRPSKL